MHQRRAELGGANGSAVPLGDLFFDERPWDWAPDLALGGTDCGGETGLRRCRRSD